MKDRTEKTCWKIGDEQVLQHAHVFDLCVRSVETPSSFKADYYYLSCPDWVNIIPITVDQEVVMIRQFRPNVGEYFLELPGGIIDAGEDPAVAALRELREETGYAANAAQSLSTVRPNPAIHNNLCHYFVAYNVLETTTPDREPCEDITVIRYPLAQIPELIRQGSINHALMLSALMALYARTDLPDSKR